MFCKSCGNQIDNDSIFCSFCGAKQSEINKPETNTSSNPSIPEAKTVNVNLSFGRTTAHKETVEKIKIEKYDLAYEKETDAAGVGILLLFVSFGFLLLGGVKDPAFYSAIVALGFIGRIVLTVWCINIAKRQNRDALGWGFFAFFLPSIALIIIGQLRKLKSDSQSENSKEDSQINVNKIKTPIRYIETKDGKTLEIHSSLETGYTVGDKVTINSITAPDGEYKMPGWMSLLVIKDGKIKTL